MPALGRTVRLSCARGPVPLLVGHHVLLACRLLPVERDPTEQDLLGARLYDHAVGSHVCVVQRVLLYRLLLVLGLDPHAHQSQEIIINGDLGHNLDFY